MFESEKITDVCSLTGHVTNLWAWQHVLGRTKEVPGTISFSTIGNTEQQWSDQVKSKLQKTRMGIQYIIRLARSTWFIP